MEKCVGGYERNGVKNGIAHVDDTADLLPISFRF